MRKKENNMINLDLIYLKWEVVVAVEEVEEVFKDIRDFQVSMMISLIKMEEVLVDSLGDKIKMILGLVILHLKELKTCLNHILEEINFKILVVVIVIININKRKNLSQ